MEKRVAYTVSFACKPYDLNDVKSAAHCHSERQRVVIAETVNMSTAQYDAFTKSFSRSTEWLDGKGGRKGSLLVKAPGRASLVVNPEGYDYARYVALA